MLKKRLLLVFGIVLSLIVFATIVSASSLVYVKQTALSKFIFDNVGNTVTDPSNSYFLHYMNNPVISGKNLYAPSIVLNGGTWNVYSCGWRDPGDGNDRIFVNTTTNNDLSTFNEPSPVLIVSNGFYVHACDPSVVKRSSNFWVMAFTGFKDYDWIAITTSTDGVAFTPNTFTDRTYDIHFTNSTSVTAAARPSLNWYNNQWYMYFDATVGGVTGQYLATSTESTPHNFSLVGRVGDMYDADIHFVGGKWVAMYRHGSEPKPWLIHWADSTDGINFTERGVLLQPDPQNAYTSDSVDNPGMVIDGSGNLKAVMFGGSSDGTLTNHKIGIAYPQSKVYVKSGSVTHVNSQASNSTQQQVETYNYNAIDSVEIDSKPGMMVINQGVNATKGAEFSLSGSSPINLFNGSNTTAVQITAGNTAAEKFTTSGSISAVDVSCPSWSNNIGNLTLTLYRWNTDYNTTVSGTPIASQVFTNFTDNAYLMLYFSSQSAGTFLWTLNNPTETVGVWKYTDSTDAAAAYWNGAIVTGDYLSRYW